MASTARVATNLDIVGKGLAGARRLTFGVAILATGTVELDTGLSNVHAFFAMCLGDTDTETVCFRVREDIPTSLGTITVDGTLLDEGSAVANASTQQFCWVAIGV
jgi:hypothetical protein